jgi:hypothetical protein
VWLWSSFFLHEDECFSPEEQQKIRLADSSSIDRSSRLSRQQGNWSSDGEWGGVRAMFALLLVALLVPLASCEQGCVEGCSGKGNCNLDLGVCECAYGFAGAMEEGAKEPCSMQPCRERRPCTCQIMRYQMPRRGEVRAARAGGMQELRFTHGAGDAGWQVRPDPLAPRPSPSPHLTSVSRRRWPKSCECLSQRLKYLSEVGSHQVEAAKVLIQGR